MRVKFLQLFVMLSVCSISALAQSVIEGESTLVVRDRIAEISLTIENKGAAMQQLIGASIIDPDGKTVASGSQVVQLERGKKRYKLSLDIGDLMKAANYDIGWHRLEYSVGASKGIASLSELLEEDFDLRATMFEHIVPGEPMRVRVRSLNPFTHKPVKGVNIAVELTIELATESDEDEVKVKGIGKTGGDGFAVIDLKIPAGISPVEDGDITITGRKNGVLREIEEDIDEYGNDGSALLTTDKPLYQPGQSFNIRGLFLDANNTVISDREAEFTIEDEDGTTLFRQEVKTSAFGIAAITWQIPENAKLGTYKVNVDDDGDLESELRFKVTRYDLPNFVAYYMKQGLFWLKTTYGREVLTQRSQGTRRDSKWGCYYFMSLRPLRSLR